jgi:hypothetical protein
MEVKQHRIATRLGEFIDALLISFFKNLNPIPLKDLERKHSFSLADKRLFLMVFFMLLSLMLFRLLSGIFLFIFLRF